MSKKWHSFTDLLPADLRRYLDSGGYQNSARCGGYSMANLLHGNPAFKAAQSKLAIAQFIGNSEMWSEAFSSMKDIYEEAKHAEDFMFCGREESLNPEIQ